MKAKEDLEQELNSRPVVLSSTRGRKQAEADMINELGLNSGEALVLIEKKVGWPRKYLTSARTVNEFLGRED